MENEYGEPVEYTAVEISVKSGTTNIVWHVTDSKGYDNAIQLLHNMKPVLKLGRTLWTVSEGWLFAIVVSNFLLAILLLMLFAKGMGL
jgi:hypothetical protein